MHNAYLTLQPFTASHVNMLERWLGCDHVKPWFPDPQEVMELAQNPPQDSGQAIVYYRRLPLGYLRWQLVSADTLQKIGLQDIPAGAADVDIFIGEDSQRGQGIGPGALDVLCQRFETRGDVPLVGLTSSVQNKEAHRAFEKAGFSVFTTYRPEGFGDCYLFTRTLGNTA